MSKTTHIKLTFALPLFLIIAGSSLFGWHMLTDTLWENHTQKTTQKLATDTQIDYNNAVVDFTHQYAGAYRLTSFIYFLEGTTQIAPIFNVVDIGPLSLRTQKKIDVANSIIWGSDLLWEKSDSVWTYERYGGSLQIRDQLRTILTEGGADGTITLERIYYDAERLSQILDMPPQLKEQIFSYRFVPYDWSVPRKK